MAEQPKRATQELNLALAGINSALIVAKKLIEEGHPAQDAIELGRTYCEAARDAMTTIQFHASHI